MTLMPSAAVFLYFFVSEFWKDFFAPFKGDLPWCVMVWLKAALQQFPSLLTAETNYMWDAGLGKHF